MKKMMISILLILMGAFSSALASDFYFNGDWSGEGSANTPRSDRFCSEIFFRLEETNETLKIINAGYRCQDLQAEYPYSQFDKGHSGKLVYKGRVVGHYAERSFSLIVPEEFYRLDVILNSDGGLSTKEVWDDSSSYLYVEGDLKSL